MNKTIRFIEYLFLVMITVIFMSILPEITKQCFADNTWKEVQDVKFKGDIKFSKPLKGTYNHGFFNYNEGQDDVKITTTGNLIDNDGKIIKSFTSMAGILVHGKEYDYFQFDIDQWRVQIHSKMENFKEKFINKVFIREHVE